MPELKRVAYLAGACAASLLGIRTCIDYTDTFSYHESYHEEGRPKDLVARFMPDSAFAVHYLVNYDIGHSWARFRFTPRRFPADLPAGLRRVSAAEIPEPVAHARLYWFRDWWPERWLGRVVEQPSERFVFFVRRFESPNQRPEIGRAVYDLEEGIGYAWVEVLWDENHSPLAWPDTETSTVTEPALNGLDLQK